MRTPRAGSTRRRWRAVLRSLGSPEEVYRQIATTASKFSTATNLEAVETGPGYTEIVAVVADGFPRHAHHCAWTTGLLSQPTVLMGDKLLVAVGERLRSCTRAQDTVARLGGDEFGVLMVDATARQDADRLARARPARRRARARPWRLIG